MPAGAIRHLDHNSPHGHEQHECGSSAGLDWTTDPKEHEMSETRVTVTREGADTDSHLNTGVQWQQVKCDRCGREYQCTPRDDHYETPQGDHCCEACLLGGREMREAIEQLFDLLALLPSTTDAR